MIISNQLNAFDYILTGTGWAEMIIGTDKGSVTAVVSYVHNPLPEIVEALNRVISGESKFEHIELDGETTQCELFISSLIEDIIRVELFENSYFGIYDEFKDKPPLPIMIVYTSGDIIGGLLVESLETMLADIGLDGYKTKWASGDEFPVNELAELKKVSNN